MTARIVTFSSLALLGVALVLGQSACGDSAGGDRATVRDSVRSIDLAVTRVEGQASRSSGPASERALAVRQLLEKWHDTHTAVFAVDPRAASGRIQSVFNLLAAISPELVVTGRGGKPAAIDDAAVARALTPDPATRDLARRERQTIDRELAVLADVLRHRPATMPIVGERYGTADDVLVRLQSRLQLLYPEAAERVMSLRLDLRR